MAPEIINLEPYNNNIDIWALGVLLYEMLHGFPPFKDFIRNKVEYKIKDFKNAYESIKFNKDVSAEAKDLISKIMQRDMNKRLPFAKIF